MNINTKSELSIDEQQQRIKQKARAIRGKLQSARHKHQAETQKKLRNLMIEHYQAEFQKFKLELEDYSQSQKASLVAIKEFKLNELSEFEKLVIQSISKLNRDLEETREHEAEVGRNYEDALQWLRKQEERDLQEARRELEAERVRKVKEYRNSIDIE